MKLWALLTFATVVGAAPPPQTIRPAGDVSLLRYESDNTGLGTYKYSFEQSDGTKKEEQGEVKNEGQEDEHIAVRGSYSWVGPDGVTYIVTYVADKNGFQPVIQKLPGGVISGVLESGTLSPSLVASLLG